MIQGLKERKYDIAFCSKMDNEPLVEFVPVAKQEPVSIIEIATPSWERLFYMATLKNVYQAPVITNFKNYVLEHAEI